MLEQTEARRAEKKIGVRSRPFPKGLDDRPLSPAPLSRGLDLARKSIAKEWSLAIWFRPQPTLEAVASYNHLIRHLSRWERKGWNSAWCSSLTHRGIQSGGGGGSQFVGDNFRKQNPAQKLLCERSLLRIYQDWFGSWKFFAQHFKLTPTSTKVLLSWWISLKLLHFEPCLSRSTSKLMISNRGNCEISQQTSKQFKFFFSKANVIRE